MSIGRIVYDYNGKLIPLNEVNLVSLEDEVSPFFFLVGDERFFKDGSIVTPRVFGSVCRSLFKKEIIYKYNLRFDESVCFGEDLLFTLMYIQRVKSIRITSAEYFYCMHPNSVTNSKYSGYVPDYVNRYKLFYDSILNYLYSPNLIVKNKPALIDYQKMSFCFAFTINELLLPQKCSTKNLRLFFADDNKRYLHFSVLNISKINKTSTKRKILLIFIKLRLWCIISLLFRGRRGDLSASVS